MDEELRRNYLRASDDAKKGMGWVTHEGDFGALTYEYIKEENPWENWHNPWG